MKPARRSAPSPAVELGNRRVWWLAALLALLVGAVYWPTLGNDFVSDDVYYVDANAELASLDGLKSIWTDFSVTPQYYPLLHTLLWGEYHLWGLNPVGYHALSMVLHLVVVMLLWRLLVVLEVPGAWVGAALFAVHPVQVESVAWVSEQKNLTSSALALMSMLFYLKFRPARAASDAKSSRSASSQSLGYYAGALACYLAALLCKTVVVTTPAVLLVIYWWKQGRLERRDVLPLLPFFGFGLALAGVTIYVEKNVVGATGEAWGLSWGQRLIVAGQALWFYLGKLAFPYPIAFFYPRWQPASFAAWQYVYPLTAVLLPVALFAARGRIGRGPLAATLIFGGVLAPALGFFNIYWFLYSFVADHFQYQASMAPLALAGAGIMLAVGRWWIPPARWHAALAAALVLLPLGLVAWRGTFAYADRRALAVDIVEAAPGSWAGHYLLGRFYLEEKQTRLAVAELNEALRLFPEHAMIRTSLAMALAALGQVDNAKVEYERALAGDLNTADRAEAHLRYGILLNRSERYDQAINHYRAAIELRPDLVDAMFNGALALRATGDYSAALQLAADAVRQQPNSARNLHAFGVILIDAERASEAIEPLTRAVQLQSESAMYQQDLARALIKAGQAERAEPCLRRALALDPRAVEAHFMLGVVLGQRGDLAGAIQEFQAALTIDPAHAGAASYLKQAEAARQAAP